MGSREKARLTLLAVLILGAGTAACSGGVGALGAGDANNATISEINPAGLPPPPPPAPFFFLRGNNIGSLGTDGTTRQTSTSYIASAVAVGGNYNLVAGQAGATTGTYTLFIDASTGFDPSKNTHP